MNKSAFLLALSLSGFGSFVYADVSSTEALNTCKDHIAGLHQDSEDLQRHVKRIKSRAGKVEVKVLVNNAGEKYNAVCKFARSGEMEFTSDRVALAKQDS